MRFQPPDEAKALRKRNAATVYVGGLLIAAFVSIPIVNLATPLFAMALMVHVHKRLGATQIGHATSAEGRHEPRHRTAAAVLRSQRAG